MNAQMCRLFSVICFQLGLFSIVGSVFIWWFQNSEDPIKKAHAERCGIFVGLWAPTLLILSNRFDRFADKARLLPGHTADSTGAEQT